MEKIQEALAKARLAREEAAGRLPGGEEAVAAIAPQPPVGVEARWQALPGFEPSRAQLLRNHVIAGNGSAEAAAFDVMRTRLLQVARANGWRRVAISSPTAGCGKTTLALNLGYGLARQPELRIVVAEFDLRRPAMARVLGLQAPQPSLEPFLRGSVDMAGAGVRLGANLAVLCAPGAVAGPSERLQSPETVAALARLEAEYDPTILLFDMPPMLVGDDVMAFAGQVDAVLLVAAAGTTSIKEIDRCERDLASQTNVMGVVLNKCEHMPQAESYGYSQ